MVLYGKTQLMCEMTGGNVNHGMKQMSDCHHSTNTLLVIFKINMFSILLFLTATLQLFFLQQK